MEVYSKEVFLQKGEELEFSEIRTSKDGEYIVYTSIVIKDTLQNVWSVLMDFENMTNWSPVFKGLIGDICNGGKVKSLYNFNGHNLEIEKDLMFEEYKFFGWEGSSGEENPDFFTDHKFIVEEVNESTTRFIQYDSFKGVLTGSTPREQCLTAQSIYIPFNRALKDEVEKKAHNSGN